MCRSGGVDEAPVHRTHPPVPLSHHQSVRHTGKGNAQQSLSSCERDLTVVTPKRIPTSSSTWKLMYFGRVSYSLLVLPCGFSHEPDSVFPLFHWSVLTKVLPLIIHSITLTLSCTHSTTHTQSLTHSPTILLNTHQLIHFITHQYSHTTLHALTHPTLTFPHTHMTHTPLRHIVP